MPWRELIDRTSHFQAHWIPAELSSGQSHIASNGPLLSRLPGWCPVVPLGFSFAWIQTLIHLSCLYTTFFWTVVIKCHQVAGLTTPLALSEVQKEIKMSVGQPPSSRENLFPCFAPPAPVSSCPWLIDPSAICKAKCPASVSLCCTGECVQITQYHYTSKYKQKFRNNILILSGAKMKKTPHARLPLG